MRAPRHAGTSMRRALFPILAAALTGCGEQTPTTMSPTEPPANARGTTGIAVELPGPAGTSNANDVTAAGVIVGGRAGGCNATMRPVKWPVEGGYEDLPLLAPWCNGTANFINESGVIVGRLNIGTTATVSVRWVPGDGGYSVEPMGALPDGSAPDLKGLNETGEAIANHNGSPGSRPYWWSAGTGWQAIPVTDGAANCYAEGLNDAGEISGQCDGTAVVWSSHDAPPDALPRLEGHDQSHSAIALNNGGVAVGYAGRTVSGRLEQTGVRWTRSSSGWTIEVLPNLGAGGTQSWDVNDAGAIVGASWIGKSKNHAFLLESGQSMRDLGSLGTESWAFAITPSSAARTVIVGVSTVGTVKRATAWRP
jgi:probable HAF family extracellular repeat protein